jgi:hypothetical protein
MIGKTAVAIRNHSHAAYGVTLKGMIAKLTHRDLNGDWRGTYEVAGFGGVHSSSVFMGKYGEDFELVEGEQ